MIHELRISGLGVIASATCRFAPGFTSVTGETGAGKTMVVTGLGLLTGVRAESALVRSGAGEAVAEGWFDAVLPEVVAAVNEAGGMVEDDAVVAARLVSARSRSVLGGRTVPTSLLGEVVGNLLVIHGQHDQTRLGARALDLLDAYAGQQTQELAREFAQDHAALRAVERELEALRTSARERARELDLLEYSLNEIASVDPQPGEDAELTAEVARLANADTLVGAAREAQEAIAADAAGEAPVDVMSLLAGARRALESAASHDTRLDEPAAVIRSVMAQLGEVAADLAGYAEDIDADPRRLAAAQDRLADLSRLTRKYGANLDEVLAWAADSARRVAELAGADDRIAGLATEVASRRVALATSATILHSQRVEAGARFATAVGAELAALAMPRARVEFAVTTSADPDGLVVPGVDDPVAFRSSGIDDVDLLLAANPGAPLRPIARAASGGELSRVMLAIQVVLAGADPVPTMVFDEVDAGVGGAAAIEVGRRLQRLSERTQVIAVTHLPQVAAFADRQLVVTKDSDGSITESSVVEVTGEERVRELSRMLAGLAESAAAGEHARELLDLARRASRGESS